MYEYSFLYLNWIKCICLLQHLSLLQTKCLQNHLQFVFFFNIQCIIVTEGQWVKTPAAEIQDLSSILRTHLVEGKTQLLQVVLRPPHVFCDTHTNKLNKFKRNDLSALPYLTLHIPTPKMILVLCFMNIKKGFDTHNGVFRRLFEPLYLGRAG